MKQRDYMPENLIGFLKSLNKHIEIEFRDKASVSIDYPKELAEVYDHTDGLSCAFMEIYQQKDNDKDSIPGWVRIGFDGYFSYILYSLTDTENRFDLWDHESGTQPEGSYSSLSEIAEELYENYLESETDNTYTIKGFPPHVKPIQLVQAFGPYIPGGYSEAKEAIKSLPLTIDVETVSDEIDLVQLLKQFGATYEVELRA